MRDDFKSELQKRLAQAQKASVLDQLRTQWRVNGWGTTPVVVEAFGDEKLLTTVTSPESMVTILDACVVGAYYLHLNEVVKDKASPWHGRWRKQSGKRNVSVDDEDIRTLRVLPIDIDPARATDKNDNASAEEQRAAFSVAAKVYLDFAEILGRDDCLSLLSSGNGWWVFVSLDALPVACQGLVIRALHAVKALYTCPEVAIDTSVSDLRRIGPLAGTWKRKARHTVERPHRVTWIAAPSEVARIDEATLTHLVSTLESRVPEAARYEITSARGDFGDVTGDNAFARCSQVRMTSVVACFDDPANPTCPICRAKGSRGNTSVRVLDDEQWNFFCCKHATCGGWKAGPVNYVAYQLRGVRTLRADGASVRAVLEWFADKFGVQIEDPPVEINSEDGMHVDDHRTQIVDQSDHQVRKEELKQRMLAFMGK